MQPLIDGSTRLLCEIGDPIAQVRAPRVWNALFHHNGLNAVCVPMHVAPGSLKAALAGIRSLGNLVGVIVTIPHKPTALAILDDASPRARQVGAVNAFVIGEDGRAVGDIFDGVGFVAGLQASEQQIDGRRALIVGAGGVGSAIAFAIAEAGVREIGVSDLIEDRAQVLSARLRGAGYLANVSLPDPDGYDLVVNASPVGMRAGDPLPFDCERLNPAAIVADVVISSELTPVLAAARQRGCFVQPGAVMTDHQIASFARFFGFEQGDWSARTIARLTDHQ